MTTIKPATPLPLLVTRKDKVAPYSGIYTEDGKQIVHENGACLDEHAQTLVHRANAYPELVAALRYLASKVEDGDDALGTQQGRVIAQDLLRKIGEQT